MDDVRCVGNESSLIHCQYSGRHNCGHNQDASVECRTSKLLYVMITLTVIYTKVSTKAGGHACPMENNIIPIMHASAPHAVFLQLHTYYVWHCLL